jgi:hypothetical protein
MSKSFTSTTDQCQYEYGLHPNQHALDPHEEYHSRYQYTRHPYYHNDTYTNDEDVMYAEAVQEFHYESYENMNPNAHGDQMKEAQDKEDEIMMDWNDPVVHVNLNDIPNSHHDDVIMVPLKAWNSWMSPTTIL